MFLRLLKIKILTWFLTLIKDQFTQYPLVLKIVVDKVLDVSIDSSSSIVGANLGGELASFRYVDITNIKNELVVNTNFEFKALRSNSRSIELECNEDGCLSFVRASWYMY